MFYIPETILTTVLANLGYMKATERGRTYSIPGDYIAKISSVNWFGADPKETENPSPKTYLEDKVFHFFMADRYLRAKTILKTITVALGIEMRSLAVNIFSILIIFTVFIYLLIGICDLSWRGPA